jgi:hypothetical protein
MPAPSYPRGMPAPLPGGSLAAAVYYTERHGTPDAVSQAEAGELHDVTRQAVHDALKKLARPPGKVGRPSRGDGPATEDVTVRLGPRRQVTLHLTEDERALLRGAAGEEDFAAWVRRKVGKRRWKAAAIRALLLAEAVR